MLSLETYWKRSVRHGRLVAVRTMSRRSRGGVHPTLGDAVDGRLSWLVRRTGRVVGRRVRTSRAAHRELG